MQESKNREHIVSHAVGHNMHDYFDRSESSSAHLAVAADQEESGSEAVD